MMQRIMDLMLAGAKSPQEAATQAVSELRGNNPSKPRTPMRDVLPQSANQLANPSHVRHTTYASCQARYDLLEGYEAMRNTASDLARLLHPIIPESTGPKPEGEKFKPDPPKVRAIDGLPWSPVISDRKLPKTPKPLVPDGASCPITWKV